MDYKKCKKCGRELPITEFYLNCRTKDGHKSKCIDCVKEEEHKRYEEKSKDGVWAEKERTRGREKYKRLSYKDATWNHKTRTINSLEGTTSAYLRRKGFDTKGKEAHHWNYNEPKSVFLMSRKAHHRIHQYLVVNYDDKFCYTVDGEKLDTVEKSEMYYNEILKRIGLTEKIQYIDYN